MFNIKKKVIEAVMNKIFPDSWGEAIACTRADQKKFNGRFRKGFNSSVVSINKNGALSLLQPFLVNEKINLKEIYGAEIFFFKSRNFLAFRFCKNKVPNALPIGGSSPKKDYSTTPYIYIKNFMERINIPPKRYLGRYTAYKMDENPDESYHYYYIDIDEKIHE